MMDSLIRWSLHNRALVLAAATLLCAAIASAQSTTLTLGTASGGGTYFVVGEVMAKPS